MSAIDDVRNTDRINYLNIGLLLLSCAVAFFVPFELFLLAYGILGPGHYLTEISWLHERRYFTKERYDLLFLLSSCFVLFLVIYILPDLSLELHVPNAVKTILIIVGAVVSFCMIFLKRISHRFIAFLVICAGVLVSKNMVVLFAVFVPTLIHVYVFTGLFMLYGAMKGRSRSGYIAFALLLVCPVLFIAIPTGYIAPGGYALEHYTMFEHLNRWILQVIGFFTSGEPTFVNDLYHSPAGVAVMRFIAFAYTYHYLNWFSKTGIIGWHKIPRQRMIWIAVIWTSAVLLYWWKFEIGFYVLLLLSLMHVFLEFPLNRITFTGIFSGLATNKRSSRPQ